MYMRQTLVLTFFFLLIALIGPYVAQGAGHKGETEILVAEGLIDYNQGRYRDAEITFTRALLLGPSHGPAAYFLGMSLYHQEKYEEADRVLKIATKNNRQNPEPFFYRGVVLYRLDDEASALKSFKKAHALAPEGPLKELAASYIRSITGTAEWMAKHRGRWFFYSSATIQYDSNVSLDPEDITLSFLPSDQSDIQFAAQIGGGYHIVRNKKYQLTTEASYAQTIYPELNEFNFGLAHLSIKNQFLLGKFRLSVPAVYEFSLLGTSKYLQSPQINPSLSYLLAKRFLTRLRLNTHYHDYFDDVLNAAQDRDAWNLETELAEYIYFDQRKRYLKLSYSFKKNWAKGSDWDYRSHTIGGAFYTPIAWDISTYIYAFYTPDKSFENVDSILEQKREDTHHHYGIRLSRPITRKANLSVHYDFHKNSSNLAIFSYNKHLVGVTFDYHI